MRLCIRCEMCPVNQIRLTFGPDSLCACCPHNTDGLCDTQDKVSRFDRKTVEYFDLHEGEYVYQDLIRAIDAQMTPAMLEDICRGCAWYPVKWGGGAREGGAGVVRGPQPRRESPAKRMHLRKMK